MTKTGEKIPNSDLAIMGAEGPETRNLAAIAAGKKLVIFGLPGAYTPTCTNDHIPGFIKDAEALREKGVDAIYCITVNDVFVTKQWSNDTGAGAAGIEVLADAESQFIGALGLEFTAPPVGLIKRSKRFAMIVDNGVISWMDVEDNPGQCALSSSGAVLSALG